MKNGKMILVGGIAIVLIVCAVFMFGGGSGTGTTTILGSDYDKAQAALKNGEPEQAIELLKKFTAENPKDAKGWVLLGDAYKGIIEKPKGAAEDAFLAYYKGFWLRSDDAAQRLAWELSGRDVSSALSGIDRISMERCYTKFAEELDPKYNELSAAEREEETTKLFILNEMLNIPFSYSMWFDAVGNQTWFKMMGTQINNTNNNQLFAIELIVRACLEVGVFGEYEKYYLTDAILNHWTNDQIKEIVKQGLKNGNNIAWMLNTLFTNGYDMPALYSRRNMTILLEDDVLQKLESNIDKLDNIGKAILLRQYQYHFKYDPQSDTTYYDSWIEDRIPIILQLAKDIAGGPYTDTKAITDIMFNIELPQEEQNKIFDAIKNARYNENGKTWNDVIKKMESVTWSDFGSSPNYPINRGVICKGKYEGKGLEIFFPVRYNALKNEWELVMDRGCIHVYIEGIEDSTLRYKLLLNIDNGKPKPDHLTPWMEEILGLKK